MKHSKIAAQLLAGFLALTMILGLFPITAAAGEIHNYAVSSAGIDISFQWTSSGLSLFKLHKTIDADLSEQGSLYDKQGGTSVTALDALAAALAHITGENAADMGNYITLASDGSLASIMNYPVSGFLYFVNGKIPGDEIYVDDGFGSSFQSAYDVTELTLQDGDSVSFVILQDQAGLSDYYTWFEESGTETADLTVKPGEAFELTLKGCQAVPFVLGDNGTQENNTYPLEGMELVLVDNSSVGTGFFDLLNVKTDAFGKAQLTFDAEGEYLVSATDYSGTAPIISPVLNVTVADISTPPLTEISELKDLIAYVEGKMLSSPDFTSDSWSSYQTALDSAKLLALSPTATAAELTEAKAVLQKAFDGLVPGDKNTYIKVPRGAETGVFKKENNYAPYHSYSLKKSDALSSFGFDVYSAELPVNTDLHIEACIPGTTVKQVRMINLASPGTTIEMTPTPLTSWKPSEAKQASNMYTNADSSGVVTIQSGSSFLLDTFRIPQTDGGSGGYFVEPEYTYELMGNSIDIEPAGAPGREQLRITGMRLGISAVKITYSPIEYITRDGSTVLLNGSDEPDIVLINVRSSDKDFDTGITIHNDFDTFYFDNSKGCLDFSFTPEAETSVRVLEPEESWDTGWTDYKADSNGSFNVKLKNGHNIIELKNENSTRCYVLRAKGIEVKIENASNPNADFKQGDTALIKLKGIDAPISKMAGIYNPGFAKADEPFIRYSNGTGSFDSNTCASDGFSSAEFTVEYTLEDIDKNILTGQIYTGIKGTVGRHREIDAAGIDMSVNPTGESTPCWFGALPEIRLPLGSSTAPTDKSSLEYAIKQAELLNSEKYTAETWQALADALDAALLVLKDDDASQDETDSATLTLADAIENLIFIPDKTLADKTKLGETIRLAGTLQEENYTAETWEVMQIALTAASLIYEKDDAEQNEINAADTVLSELISKLEIKPGIVITDKTELIAAIQSAKALNPAEYTAASWSAFEAVLVSAELVRQNPDASQAEVDAAAVLLSNAASALVITTPESPADKSILNAMITVAKSLSSEKYTAETWAVLETALANAQDVYDKADATQSEADLARVLLSDAVSALMPVHGEGVDKSVLNVMIAAASELKSADYTPETWAALEAALADAQRISQDPQAVQMIVDAANTALSQAIKALVPITGTVIDKSTLYELIQKAETYNSSNYTSASWRAMQDVLTQAKAVYGNVNAIQTEVSAIALTLSDKIDALVKYNSGSGNSIGIGNGGHSGTSPSGGSNTENPKPPTIKPGTETPPATDNSGTPSGSGNTGDTDNSSGPDEKPDGNISDENPFTDILGDDWYYDFVLKAYKSGLMKGVVDTEFLPDGTFSRGMLVTMLYRYDGTPAVIGSIAFSDVSAGEWYTDAIKWASALDLVQGYGDGLFGTGDPVTREQFVTILYKYAQTKGFNVKKTASLSAFEDGATVSDWAHDAVSWALAEELIYGRDDVTLAPEGTSTRAEAATLIIRFIEKFQ